MYTSFKTFNPYSLSTDADVDTPCEILVKFRQYLEMDTSIKYVEI